MTNNWIKTTILMAGILALFGIVGGAIGGKGGMLIALLLGGGLNLWAYWNSDKMMLRMYNAHEVDASIAPEFYGMVAELAQRAGMPMPRVYIIDEEQPNAFATGRDPQHAAVAATTGILRLLDYRELRGVMAHELAHVRNRDTLISTISATVAGAISALANMAMFASIFSSNRDEEGSTNPIVMLLVSILAPIAASLIQMAISRTREFGADRIGSEISGDPLALAAALRKIEYYAQGRYLPAAEAHPETAQMMIINPLSGQRSMSDLFRTHPRTEERINRLEAMARGDWS
ncbi:zinc metalloprotease HtpX [Laribacter hongkongensis]|uniref:Protease HtpX homolog n=1 Tax=Laribacter hongkongensis TaxID=168471 RepID=A0AAW5DPR4_9NEIS|nr:zinc metalloprotease HtpX [Laribacter hongkongensis]MCG8995945.1 zinc metalloprotease HtpX [Laribacter hongkongensis]MCG9010901.1 zinc metalloprotease HtpX [Laribacter hongkongensis]MCG9023609.1 zinc metalloprotease HtpX [Laribacter hongkongensis]MCG9027318.1 zinc metalloprotease HtpX [Laribacter hongkongensis]MCG9047833.1 zinc metalloprotease HtpX [Laribacter hongkongensis]